MEVQDAKHNKIAVFCYEAVASALLVIAFNWTYSKGNFDKDNDIIVQHCVGYAFAYFAIFLIAGSVSGAHANPAITLAVYIQSGGYTQGI